MPSPRTCCATLARTCRAYFARIALSACLLWLTSGMTPALASDVASITSWTTSTTGPSRTTSGTDRLLVLVVSAEAATNVTISSATYGGRSMTQVLNRSAGTGPYEKLYIYYLKDAQIALATSNTIAVTWSATTDDVHYAARMYQYVDQTNPIRDSDSATTNAATPNPIVTPSMTVEDGDMVVAGAVCGNVETYTWNNSYTEGTDHAGATSQQSSAQFAITSNGTSIASATNNNPNRQVIAAAVLQNNTVPVPTTYYVRPDGSDTNTGKGTTTGTAWKTIQKAVANSSLIPGDTIYVMTGTYTEQLNPTKDGTSALPIRVIADTTGAIFGGSGGSVTVQAPSNVYAADFSGDDYFELRGFKLRGSGTASTVLLSSTVGMQLTKCDISLGGKGVDMQGSTSTLTMINCLIQGVTDDGVHIYNGTATIRNCTIADNAADGIEQDAGTSSIRNCILATNTADGLDLNAGTMSHTYNVLYGNNGNFEGTSASTGETTSNPKFVNTATDDYHLQGGSSAIDGGTDLTGTVDDDLDGLARPIGAAWDMGCYEFTLIATWNLDDGAGTTATDNSGNGHSGTLQGSTAWESVRCGSGVKLNGTSDWVNLGALGLGSKSFTMSAWFKSSTAAVQTIFAATATGGTNHVMFAQLDATGRVQFVFRSPAASSGGTTLTSSGTYIDGSWHHVAVVKSITDVQLYVDGGLVDTLSNTSGVNSAVNLALGRAGVALASNYFKGSLDEVVLYGTALSASEVGQLSHFLTNWKLDSSSGAVAVDSTVWAHDGVVTGSPVWQPTGGKVGGALLFDGVNDKIEDADAEDFLNGLSEITVTMWVKSTLTNVDKDIFFTANPSGSDDRLGMRYDQDGLYGGQAKVIKVSISTTGGTAQVESSANVQTTAWQHLAVVWSSGSAIKLYINGQLDTLSYSDGARTGTLNNMDRLTVGIGTKSAYWNGLIDEFRIYDRALCADDIYNISQGGAIQGVRVIKWVEIK